MRIGHALDADELRVEDRLALHHRQRRDRPDVAEPEHARAVRADRDRPPERREPRRDPRVLGDRRATPARRPACRRRARPGWCGSRGPTRLELAAVVRDERAVVEPDDRHAVERRERLGELLGARLVAHLDGDLADRLAPADRDRRDLADHAPARRSRSRPSRASRRGAGIRSRYVQSSGRQCSGADRRPSPSPPTRGRGDQRGGLGERYPSRRRGAAADVRGVAHEAELDHLSCASARLQRADAERDVADAEQAREVGGLRVGGGVEPEELAAEVRREARGTTATEAGESRCGSGSMPRT